MSQQGILPETFIKGFHDEEAVKKMIYNPLGTTGLNISRLSLGSAAFCSLYGDFSLDECKNVVKVALKKGINYLDTAPYYGHGVAEEVLGKCLVGIPRESYYIATKVGRYEKDPKLMFDFSAAKTRKSIDLSLKRLGVDYIDVIQMHDVEFAPSLDIVLNETLPVLIEYQKLGKVKFIGVNGYPVSTLAEFVKLSKCRIDTVLSYARLTLIDQTLNEFIPLFKSKKMGIINAAVYAMGLLTNAGPQSWHPAPDSTRELGLKARTYCKENNVELGKLAFYYALQQTETDTVLVGVNSTDVLNLNFEVLHNGLTKEEEKCYEYLQKEIFNNLGETHWEGREKF